MKPAKILYGGLQMNIRMITSLVLRLLGQTLKAKAVKELSGKRLFVVDTFCGANEATRLKVRFIMEVAWQAHFVDGYVHPSDSLRNWLTMVNLISYLSTLLRLKLITTKS